MCLNCFSFNSLSWKVYGSNPNSWSFKFIKNLAQIMITFSKVSKTKINLIYAKMVKVLWYIGIFLDEGKNSPNIIIGMTIIGK